MNHEGATSACPPLRARPRSLRARRFQRPRILHPYSPNPFPKRSPKHLQLNQPAQTRHRTLHGGQQQRKATAPRSGAIMSSTVCCEHPAAFSASQASAHQLRLQLLASQSGPKSGSYFKLMLGSSLIASVGGVRVPLDSTSGGRPAVPTAGKHRGPTPTQASVIPLQHPTFRIAQSAKRAYRRARLRAHSSPNQGTWYKGRWHTAESLGQLPQPLNSRPRRVRPQPATGSRQVPHLNLFSWNASGLSSALFQELMAWCDTQTNIDALVIQETHWHETGDFQTGQWIAMHTSGRASPDGFGRCSGILFLLRRQQFKDPRFLEVLPGRLALLQATSRVTNLPVSILGVYQHVWRSSLTSARNLELRHGLLDHLDKTLLTIPRRHHLVLCGDFNSTIRPEHPIIGSSVPAAEVPCDNDLVALLHKHSLCVLNTWHAQPSTTYFSPSGATQIDYIIARQQAAYLRAKRASPDHAFPVGGHRLTGHYPVRAQLPMQSYHRSAAQDPAAGARLDLAALQQAVQQASPEALSMQARIASRLQQVDTSQLTSAHRHINRILLEEASNAFPPQPKPDVRVSAHPTFRVTTRLVWHLYRQFKRPSVCALHTIFQQVAFGCHNLPEPHKPCAGKAPPSSANTLNPRSSWPNRLPAEETSEVSFSLCVACHPSPEK